MKEWAVVVNALAAGRQVILLRKGGILDKGGEFHLQHSEFFLYPTFEHQHRKYLREEFLPEFDRTISGAATEENITLSVYAEVVDVLSTRQSLCLRQLAAHHIWNDEFLEMRLGYKPELSLHVLFLRAYRVAPVVVPVRPEYAGCKSWVDFDRDLSIRLIQPALADKDFEARRGEINHCLQAEDSSSTLSNPRERL